MANGNFIVKAANLLVNQSEFNEGKGRYCSYCKQIFLTTKTQ